MSEYQNSPNGKTPPEPEQDWPKRDPSRANVSMNPENMAEGITPLAERTMEQALPRLTGKREKQTDHRVSFRGFPTLIHGAWGHLVGYNNYPNVSEIKRRVIGHGVAIIEQSDELKARLAAHKRDMLELGPMELTDLWSLNRYRFRDWHFRVSVIGQVKLPVSLGDWERVEDLMHSAAISSQSLLVIALLQSFSRSDRLLPKGLVEKMRVEAEVAMEWLGTNPQRQDGDRDQGAEETEAQEG